MAGVILSVSGTYLGFSTGGYKNNSGYVYYLNKIYGLKKTSDNGYTWEEVHSMRTVRKQQSVVNARTSLLSIF